MQSVVSSNVFRNLRAFLNIEVQAQYHLQSLSRSPECDCGADVDPQAWRGHLIHGPAPRDSSQSQELIITYDYHVASVPVLFLLVVLFFSSLLFSL